MYAHSVVKKGSNPGACKLIADELDRLGYKKIVLKSDGEPRLVTFLDSVTRSWSGLVVPERSKRGDPQSNCEIERAVQALCAQVRAMEIALDSRLETRLQHSGPILSWMVEYAAVIVRRHLVGTDSRTAYERLKGRGDRQTPHY